MTTFHSVDNEVYAVEIEAADHQPGLHRLVSPYGEAHPYNEACPDGTADWDLTATTPMATTTPIRAFRCSTSSTT